MEYVTLGSTGTTVSRLCFGTWRFGKEKSGTVETDRDEAHELLDTAWDLGINFIDTANVYGDPTGTSERWIGEWLEDVDREEVVLASKVRGSIGDHPNSSGLSRKHIRAQIDESLDRLGTEYLDVYYLHWWDEDTSLRETLATLDDLVHDGKVHYVGASKFTVQQLSESLRTSDVENLERFTVAQPRYNVAYRDQPAEYLSVCAEQKLAVCPFSPLEGGFLTGKYEQTDDGTVVSPDDSRGDLSGWDDRFEDRQWQVLAAVRDVADEVDGTPAQVALRWLMENGEFTCVPIVGARTPEQLSENAGAVEIELTTDQYSRITDAYEAE